MKKFTAVDWQSFSLKKDIEIITKRLKETNAIRISISVEIALVVFSVSFSNIFCGSSWQKMFWIISMMGSILVILIPIGQWLYRRYVERKPGNDRITPKVFIDSFDNAICYYTLMAESYYSMLFEVLPDKNIKDEIKRFYYIEASYYMNKAVADLSPIAKISEKVLTKNPDEVIEKRLISIARYNNIKNMLEIVYSYLDEKKEILNDLKDGEMVIKTNRQYMVILKNIDEVIEKQLKK